MNEARMYADGFETMFAKQGDFMAFLKQIGRVSPGTEEGQRICG